MRHLATYLLLVIGGNASPTAQDVTNALSQCGVEVDEELLAKTIAELAGKDLEEIIKAGEEKLCKGQAMAAPAGAPVAGGAAPAAAAAIAAPVEEEVDALAGGMDMFGGDEGGGDY
jgi:large subunit ribosomal protein LP2